MICLTDDEVRALRQVLAMLATIGERGFANDKKVCEITYQVWRDMVLKPAANLSRVGRDRRIGVES